jgi:hypothetical protein
VNAMPAEWLIPPRTGEVFDSILLCKRRLRGFSLAKGFDIVQMGEGNARVPGARFLCIHHGKATRNWRRPRAAPRASSFSSPPSPLTFPSSTAPARLAEGRGARKRRHTERYEAGIATGDLDESQHGAIGRR